MLLRDTPSQHLPWSSSDSLTGGAVFRVSASERACMLALALHPLSYSVVKTWHTMTMTMTMQEVDKWEWDGLANVGGVSVASVGQMQFWWANDFGKSFSRLHFCLYFSKCVSQGGEGHWHVTAVWPSEEPNWETTVTWTHLSALHPQLASVSPGAETTTSPQLCLVLKTVFPCGCSKISVLF